MTEDNSEGWTRTVSEFNIGRIRDEEWERDRQVVLSQLHNLLLALRSNTRFTTRPVPQQRSASPIPLHPLTVSVRDLRERLFYPSATAGREDFSAEELLAPFCNVIVSEETTEPITGVALAAFVAFLDLKCSFLTPQALKLMSETARGSRSEIADAQSHEAVLARILQVYVGCARHPSAERMPEKEIVAMLQGAYTVATYGEPSELLRRTAEQAMNDMVTAVFERVLGKISVSPKHARIFSTVSHANLTTPLSQADATNFGESSFMATDGSVILEYICTLISSPTATADTYQVSAAAVQLQGLCLAHTVLFLLKDELIRAPALLKCVRNNMCRALLRVGSNCTNVIVLSQLLRTAHLVVQFAAIDVVPQALSIIDQLHLEPLQRLLAPSGGAKQPLPMSPTSTISSPRSMPSATNQYLIDSDFAGNEAHEMLMESFLEFCANTAFPTFCYAHYDLSLEYKGLLETVCKFVAQCVAQSVMGATSSAPCVGMLGEDTLTAPYALETVRWAEVGVLALDGLTAMIRSIHQRVTHPDYSMAQRNAEGQDVIAESLRKKKRLQDFADLFDKEEYKKAVAFILTPPETDTPAFVGGAEKRQVDCFGLGKGSSGWDLGEFLFRHKAALDRTAIGNFLGELGKEPVKPEPSEDPDGTLTAKWEEDRRDDYKVPMSVRFFAQVLKGFLNCFNCSGKSLIRAIREVMYQMKLPGESQKIDRFMETFANHWFSVNKDAGPEVNPFTTVDGAFILAFSIIMLNTDLHSGKIAKVMSKEEFKRMNRGIDNGKSLPDSYLDEIYDDVKANQIVMIDMIRQGYSNDSVWTLEVNEAKCHAAQDLPIGLRTNVMSQLAALDPYVFNIMWQPCITGLMTVLTSVCAACDGAGSPMLTKDVTSLRSVWSVLKSESKKNYDVIRASSEGILRCAETAAVLNNTAALDHIVTSLAQHLIPCLRQWLSSGEPTQYGRAGKSVLVLIFVHLLMKVVDRFGGSMDGGWQPFCEVWELLFLCGVFSDSEGGGIPSSSVNNNSSINSASVDSNGQSVDADPSRDGSRSRSRSPGSVSAPPLVEPTLRSTLRQSPIAMMVKRSTTPSAAAAQGGGWFSGLWGGSNQMLLDEQRREQMADDRAAMSRLRSAIPSLQEMFQMEFTNDGLSRLLHTLCLLGEIKPRCGADGGAPMEVDPSAAYASSFIAQLVVEIAIYDVSRVNFHESSVFAFLRSLMNVSFTMLQQCNTRGASGSANGDLGLWKSITDRVVDAVMALINGLSRSEETRESLFLLLSDLTSLPEIVFRQVIAEPLGKLLANLLEPQSQSGDEEQKTSESLSRNPLRSCTKDGWTRLIGAARMVAVRAPSQAIRMLAVRILVLMAREASVGGWATLAHLQGIAMSIAEVLSLDPISSASGAMVEEAYEIVQSDSNPMLSLGTSVLVRYEAVAEQAPEALFMLHKTVVSSRFMQTGLGSSAKPEDVAEWTGAWLTCIGALATLAASVPNDKIASDALLATQRCILDDRLLLLDAHQVVQLFHTVLLPLMETICNTSIAAERGPVTVANASGAPGQQSAPAASGGVASYLLPSVLLSAVFGPMAGPEKKREATSTSTSSAAAPVEGTAGSPSSSPVTFKPPQKLAMARNDEVQCRCIGIGPKALLHFTDKLSASTSSVVSADGTSQPIMTTLWREVIGTLYALYSSGNADSVLLDAIKENIRNVVHVLVALCAKGSDTAMVLGRTNPQFWIVTKSLLKPFPFSDALLAHVEEQGLR